MSDDLSPIDAAKSAAALRAAGYVKSGMKVGLGTGSTAAFLVSHLGRMVREEGLEIVGVPTSTRTADQARAEGIPLTTLDAAKWLDVTIDGADEYDADLALIKGGGGALLHEKVVATASDRMIVIADESKFVPTLGAYPLPVEVLGFGMATTQMLLEEMLEGLDVAGTKAVPRLSDGTLFVTDEGNHILDLHLGRIGNARQLSLVLNQVPGVVENGLFVDICDICITAFEDGSIELRDLHSDQIETSGVKNIFADLAD
ncbi:MAG: ribose-5-phosphate isomerase RpiA [Pseudomonadota bacterium]